MASARADVYERLFRGLTHSSGATTVSFQELSAGSRAAFVVDLSSRSCRENGSHPLNTRPNT